MSSDLQQRIDSVKRKAGLMAQRISMLESAQTDYRRQIADLTQKVATLERELEEARLKLDYTAIVSAIAPQAGDVKDARELLSRLVCEIDRCITDLND